MDGWISSSHQLFGDTAINFNDALLSKVVAVKKGLQAVEVGGVNDVVGGLGGGGGGIDTISGIASVSGLTAPSIVGTIQGLSDTDMKSAVQLFMSCCDGDSVTFESLVRSFPQLVNQVYPEQSGITMLIFAICFGHFAIVESLLQNHAADPDLNDTVVHYTPLMWAVHLNQLDMIELLFNYQADPYLAPKEKNAVDLVTPEQGAIYEYFKSHNLVKAAVGDQEDYFKMDNFGEDPLDDLSAKIKLQTITDDLYNVDTAQEEGQVYEEDDENYLVNDYDLVHLGEFDYEKLLHEQYIKFTDSDIPSILDYVFSIRTRQIQYQHTARVPSAIIFQLIRYGHLKVDSKELTEFLFDSFVARLRSVTNTKSGVLNMATVETSGDIVLLSYWLSALQFLHFYFIKNNIYNAFPRFLQELISLFQSLIVSLSFSINTRLDDLVDDCILNFTNLVDVSNTLYAKDWNFFKNSKSHPSTFEDVQKMLYPPKENELMKPSPIRYIQVLGALDYVLRIHNVDNLTRMQTFSQVFYYNNSIIFNRIISQSRYCSRSKAIQIRLNISTIEDWLRSHDFKVSKVGRIGGLNRLLGDEEIKLHNLLLEEWDDGDSAVCKDPHYLQFYYNSLYFVGKTQFQPTIEILQWLQCATLLADEESLINTINQFDTLNYYQIYKVIHKLYRYEVNEVKISKKLANLVKSLMNQEGENQIARFPLHYMTQSTFLNKEIYIYLNPNHIFDIALPNKSECISNYGAGLGGVRVLRAKKYQPSLPVPIQDDVDEILQQNREHNNHDSFEYEENNKSEDDENDDPPQDTDYQHKQDFKGDEIFKEVQLPSSLAHRNWGESTSEFESNPW
jgi:hypothetical protein